VETIQGLAEVMIEDDEAVVEADVAVRQFEVVGGAAGQLVR